MSGYLIAVTIPITISPAILVLGPLLLILVVVFFPSFIVPIAVGSARS